MNFKLVIKMHPKESTKKIYYKIFGKNNYNLNWEISDDHVFTLSSKAIFSICFFSGVSIDLIKCKIPVLELLNLQGLKEFDNEQSLRDEKGKPVLDYRFLKLVKGIENEKDLFVEANRILEDKSYLVKFQSKQLSRLFSNQKNPSNLIYDHIRKRI